MIPLAKIKTLNDLPEKVLIKKLQRYSRKKLKLTYVELHEFTKHNSNELKYQKVCNAIIEIIDKRLPEVIDAQ